MEDASWLLVLAQAAALGAQCAGLERRSRYRRLVRPLTLLFCLFCLCSILFIIPKAGNFVNFYGVLIDWYKLAVWAWLAACAAFGLVRDTGWTSFFVLSACGVLGVSLLAGIGDSNAFEPIYGAWQNEYAGFALVLLFGGLMVRRNAQLLRESAELQSVKLQNRFAAESAVQLRETMREVRGVKHELNHHIDALAALATTGDWPRLRDYLDTLRAQKDDLPPLQYTNHFLINAILASYLGPAQRSGVKVSCHAELPEELPIPDADLCTLLANLLSNAAEACAALPLEAEPFIDVELSLRNGELLIFSCVNSAPTVDSAEPFRTTKADGESHGLGLPAMERVAEKYNGALNASQKDGRFTVKGVLALPK